MKLPPEMRPPRGNGAARGRKHRSGDASRILNHPALYRNAGGAIPTTCRRTLADLARARREFRETVSPSMCDALDMAMESLRTALTIAELEGRNDG